MAKDTRITDTLRNLQANSVKDEYDDGWLYIYDGTRPAGPSVAVTTQVLLSKHPLDNPAMSSASGGVCTFNPIGTVNAVGSGTATWGRMKKADDTTPLSDVSVGMSNANIILTNTTIVAGVPVSIVSLTMVVPAQTLG
jgi:hypothetical protein